MDISVVRTGRLWSLARDGPEQDGGYSGAAVVEPTRGPGGADRSRDAKAAHEMRKLPTRYARVPVLLQPALGLSGRLLG
jgi:hypothetical protein